MWGSSKGQTLPSTNHSMTRSFDQSPSASSLPQSLFFSLPLSREKCQVPSLMCRDVCRLINADQGNDFLFTILKNQPRASWILVGSSTMQLQLRHWLEKKITLCDSPLDLDDCRIIVPYTLYTGNTVLLLNAHNSWCFQEYCVRTEQVMLQ